MDQLKHLFQFKLTKAAINQHLNEWMLMSKTDYFYDGQQMYADIYGTGKHYAIMAVPSGNGYYDVYADMESVKHVMFIQKLLPGFSRKKKPEGVKPLAMLKAQIASV